MPSKNFIFILFAVQYCMHSYERAARVCVCRLLINLSLLNGCIIGLDGWHTQTGEWRRSLIGPPMHTHFVHDIFAHTCVQLYDFCRARTNFVVVVHTSDRRVATANPKFIQFFVFCFCIHLFMFNSYCCCNWSKKKRLWTSGRWPGQTNIYNRHTKMEKKKNIEFQLITRR